jgi:hypothetical protein
MAFKNNDFFHHKGSKLTEILHHVFLCVLCGFVVNSPNIKMEFKNSDFFFYHNGTKSTEFFTLQLFFVSSVALW